MRTRRLSSKLALLLVAAFAPMAAPSVAIACGGLFCQRTPVEQAGERILFATDGENVTAHVQIQYQGKAEDFSWIVPVPTEPKLSVGSDALFAALRQATQPVFRVNIDKTEGTCKQEPMMRAAMPGTAAAASDAKGVSVVSEDQVGPFQTAVLQADDSGKLKAWLTENKYVVPPTIDPLLDPYISGQYYFIALKLRKNQDVGDLQPIAFSYKSTKPGVPIRLTGVAATPDMGVYVWVLGKQRAVPENFKHAEINEARIDWPSGGGNYAQVVTEAMNEAGGQAFVTDYAGKSGVVQLDAFDESAIKAFVDEVAKTTDPVAFTQLVMQKGFVLQQFAGGAAPMPRGFGSSQRQMAFLRRYVPKPDSLAAIDESQFYFNISQHAAALAAAQVTVNAAGAAKELDETLVKPAREIREMFAKHAYMTRLYTTLSPDEMTQDPVFVFNPDLPEVSNIHEAKGVRKCSADVSFGQAPVELTLKNGFKFMVTGGMGGGLGRGVPAGASSSALAMPAALRIEQLKTSGQPSVITDNKGKIQKTLEGVTASSAAVAVDVGTGKTVAVPVSARGGTSGGTSAGGGASGGGGFGCAGCANPAKSASGGAGEGLTFALFALGLAGWRLRAGRKG